MITKPNIETVKFIREHYNDDLPLLALHREKYKSIDIDLVLREISSRIKLEKKMPDWVDNYDLIMSKPVNIEQSSSCYTSKFKFDLYPYIDSIDLSCGFGIDSFYMASNSTQHIAIEPSEELSSVVAHNFRTLGFTNTDVICSTAEHFLDRNETVFDMVYLDPSRRSKSGSRKILLEDYHPDITTLFHDLKRISRRLMIKLSPMLDITALVNLFPEVNKVYVLSVDGECKELLLVFDFVSLIKGVSYHAVELTENKFEYIFEKDDELEIDYGIPQQYLYDVHPAIMKTGFHDSYAMSLGLMKISRNSHLYTSDILLNNFSGKIYEMISSARPNQKDLESVLRDMKAIVIRKDFPLTAESIRAKFKISEGKDITLFAVKLLSDKNSFLIARRLR